MTDVPHFKEAVEERVSGTTRTKHLSTNPLTPLIVVAGLDLYLVGLKIPISHHLAQRGGQNYIISLLIRAKARKGMGVLIRIALEQRIWFVPKIESEIGTHISDLNPNWSEPNPNLKRLTIIGGLAGKHRLSIYHVKQVVENVVMSPLVKATPNVFVLGYPNSVIHLDSEGENRIYAFVLVAFEPMRKGGSEAVLDIIVERCDC